MSIDFREPVISVFYLLEKIYLFCLGFINIVLIKFVFILPEKIPY